MNWREVSVGAAVWLCLMCSVAPGQAPGLPAEPLSPQTAAKPPDENTPRELVYPYDSLRDGAQSMLSMMDRAPRPVEFTVAIHSQSGRTVVSQTKTIGPNCPKPRPADQTITSLCHGGSESRREET
jgi:hypothetical protein